MDQPSAARRDLGQAAEDADLVEAPDVAAGFESEEDEPDELDEPDDEPESDDFEPESDDFESEEDEVDAAAEVDEPLDFVVERESVR
ncbi:hypothetical protein OHA72_03655 [Dactylosporangium sp. NBC_01737]|uniref:hypothetical protein n=1 Tax=Dactylosporangium sp. NBC_01737 TaxID=2975959 RepID=UPI002E15D0C3|nr:hypothetical protein OHA72_03655 [Dactylosporangium sp. NBC_01737]